MRHRSYIDWVRNSQTLYQRFLLTQAVQLFNNRSTVASIQKQNRNVQADQVKADKAVVKALKTVAH
jgi:hypothetical protein